MSNYQSADRKSGTSAEAEASKRGITQALKVEGLASAMKPFDREKRVRN